MRVPCCFLAAFWDYSMYIICIVGLLGSILPTHPLDGNLQVGPGSFTVMLSSLMTGRSLAREAAEVGQLLDPDWWEGRGWPLPPLPPQRECRIQCRGEREEKGGEGRVAVFSNVHFSALYVCLGGWAQS